VRAPGDGDARATEARDADVGPMRFSDDANVD
jgi:hypothetical protein